MRTATRRKTALTFIALVLTILGGVSALTRSARADETPWLGVYTQALTSELREGIDYDGDGVLVSGVVPDSPADRAGLQKGDVITRVEGREVNSPGELVEVIRGAAVGERVSIRYVRDGQTRVLEVRLVARENSGNESEVFDVPTPPAPPAPSAPRTHFRREIKSTEDSESSDDQDEELGEDRGKEHSHEMKGMKDLDGLDLPDHPIMGLNFKGRLGVRIENLNEGLGSYFKIPEGQGALVVEVVEGSAAAKAGLESGDVITRVGDQRVSGDNLAEVVRAAESPVSITFYRNGSRRTVEVALDDAPTPRSMMTWKHKDGDAPGATMWKDKDGDVRILRLGRGSQDDAALRQEIRELRKQLEELKRELEDLKNDR